MSRKAIPVSQENILWLADNFQQLTYKEMAQHIGTCVDTLKRILVRNGIADLEDAKCAMPIQYKTWNRPCIQCKSTETRPKNIYICDSCKEKINKNEID